MIKILRSDDVWQPRLGAPRANRNARTHGRSDAEARALRKRIAAYRRRARDLLAILEGEIERAHQ
jgi:hypothetical protein